MRLQHKGIYIALISAMVCETAAAGAWSLKAGEGQVISTSVYDRASRYFGDNGRPDIDAQFEKLDSRIFWEHGLTSRLTLVGSTALQDVSYQSRDGFEQVRGLGSSLIAARYPVYRDEKSVISMQAGALIAGAGENISDADLGRGGDGAEIRLLYGRNVSVFDRPGFVDIQSAWTLRPSGQPDSQAFDVSAALNLTRNVQWLGQAFYSRTGEQIILDDRILANQSLKLQTSIVYWRKPKRGYQIGYMQTVAGRNIVEEKALIIGIWQRY